MVTVAHNHFHMLLKHNYLSRPTANVS